MRRRQRQQLDPHGPVACLSSRLHLSAAALQISSIAHGAILLIGAVEVYLDRLDPFQFAQPPCHLPDLIRCAGDTGDHRNVQLLQTAVEYLREFFIARVL